MSTGLFQGKPAISKVKVDRRAEGVPIAALVIAVN